MLPRLCHMAEVRLGRIWTIPCGECGCEARPRGVRPPAYGGYPCGLSWVAGAGMEVCNKCWDAGEVVRASMRAQAVRRLPGVRRMWWGPWALGGWKGVGWVRRYQCGVLLRVVRGLGWCDVYSPEARAGGFSLAMKNGSAVAVVDRECLFCEEGGTVGVTQLP